MTWPAIILLIGAVLLIVGETWGIIRSDEGPDTITEFVKMVTTSDRGWIAVPGMILVGGALIWALLHFAGVA